MNIFIIAPRTVLIAHPNPPTGGPDRSRWGPRLIEVLTSAITLIAAALGLGS